MPNFLIQVAYTQPAWEALIRHPQDRSEAVKTPIAKLGGKVQHVWFAFGQHDVLLVAEMPTAVDAAAIAIAFAAGGACKSVQTTPLLTVEEAIHAMKKASECGYKPIVSTAGRAA